MILGPIPVTASFVPDKKQVPEQFPIASDEAVYAGEPVAVVIAEDRYLADDAAQLVVVDYEPLPAVMDLEKAMAPGSPLVKSDRPDNIGWDAVFPSGDIDAAFAEADVVVKERIGQQRLFPTAMETRGCVADWTPVRQPGDALDVDAGAALHPALRRRRARRAGVAVPRDQPRRRRRLRREAPPVSRGVPGHRGVEDLRTPGQVDRGPYREPAGHDAGSRSALRRGGGREARRHAARAEVHAAARHRRVSRRVQRLPGGRVPPRRRLLRLEGDQRAERRHLHQPHVDRPVPRRRTTGGHASRRARGRPRRARDRHGSGGGPAQELRQDLPAHEQLRARLRLRRLREVARSRHGEHRLPGAPQAPGGVARPGSLHGHRIQHLGRDLRNRSELGDGAGRRPGARRVVDGASASHRLGDRLGRHPCAWTEPRDHLRADRRRHARRAVRVDRDPARRHR